MTVCISAGDSPDDLYDRCHQIAELLSAENHKNASRFFDRRSGAEIGLADTAKYQKEVNNADSEPESGNESNSDKFLKEECRFRE